MDQVARLGLNQHVELGITLAGYQKKINNSIQALRAQLSVSVSYVFFGLNISRKFVLDFGVI